MSIRKAAAVVLLGSLLGGCGGKEQTAASPTPAETKSGLPSLATPNSPAQVAPAALPPGAPAPQSAAAPTLPAGAKDENGEDIGLQKIQEALEQFVSDNERLPNGLEELVKCGLLGAVPSAPQGMKYLIDPQSKMAALVKK